MPLQDAPLPDSLLPYAHAQVLKEMMSSVVDNPPLEYRAEKEKAEGEAADSAAKAAEAAARRAAQEAAQPQAAAPAAPEHAPSPGAVRQNPRRQSKDDANRKLSGKAPITPADLSAGRLGSSATIRTSLWTFWLQTNVCYAVAGCSRKQPRCKSAKCCRPEEASRGGGAAGGAAIALFFQQEEGQGLEQLLKGQEPRIRGCRPGCRGLPGQECGA